MNLRRVFLTGSATVLIALGVVATSTPAPQPQAATTATAASKVVVFMEENHSLSQMKAGMPYLFGLAKKYGYADNWTAARHPSLPNYLAIAGGSTFGVTTNGLPTGTNGVKVGSAISVFDQAINAGKTAKVYAEGMPSNCSLVNNTTGKYAVKHNPWAYFTTAGPRGHCNQFDVPTTGLIADATNNNLPNAGMVVPNLCNDAHNCSLTIADNWLKTRIGPMLTSTDFTSGALTIVVTADEDGGTTTNKVLTVVMHTGMNGVVVTTALTHYSLSAYLSQVIGVTPLLNAKTAPSMAAAFGL